MGGLWGGSERAICPGGRLVFPPKIVTGPGAAYVFLVYSSQVVLTFVVGIWGFVHEGGARKLRGALEGEPTSELDAAGAA